MSNSPFSKSWRIAVFCTGVIGIFSFTRANQIWTSTASTSKLPSRVKQSDRDQRTQPPHEMNSDTFLITSPIDFPLRLSGTFGELRSGHFHQGIDVKSRRGVAGDAIYSIGEGYISRLKVAADGYGNAIYIQHPNGLTSVYAHLQSFSDQLDSVIVATQYEFECFEVDLEIPPAKIPIKGGQEVGKMGSTGHSFGPHLHFEIRKTNTGDLLNPMYLFSVQDKVAPKIESIQIHLLDHRYITYQTIDLVEDGQKVDTFEIDAWRVGLGVETFDPHNRGINRNGVFSVKMYCDGETIYSFQFDTLAAKDLHYYQAHLGGSRAMDGQKHHRCFRSQGNQATFYQKINDGVIPLFQDRYREVRIEVSDFDGNTTNWQTYLKRTPEVTAIDPPPFQYFLPCTVSHQIKVGGLDVEILPSTLIEDVFMTVQHFAAVNGALSNTYALHPGSTRLMRPFRLSMDASQIAHDLRDKVVVSNVTDTLEMVHLGAEWQADTISAWSNQFGSFALQLDTTAPTIQLIQTKPTVDHQIFTFKITDSEKYGNGCDKLVYRLEIDDRWHLAKYDLKSSSITCKVLKSKIGFGEHLLKLVVSDYVGNSSTYDYRFNFK